MKAMFVYVKGIIFTVALKSCQKMVGKGIFKEWFKDEVVFVCFLEDIF